MRDISFSLCEACETVNGCLRDSRCYFADSRPVPIVKAHPAAALTRDTWAPEPPEARPAALPLGWLCPRCKRSNAPTVLRCTCGSGILAR